MASLSTAHQINLVINKLTKATLDELSSSGRLNGELSNQLFMTTDENESGGGSVSVDGLSAQLSAHDMRLTTHDNKLTTHDNKLTTHDTDIKTKINALSSELSSMSSLLTEIKEYTEKNMNQQNAGATNCLEYSNAISWTTTQHVSSDAMPWDARVILLSSMSGYSKNLYLNDVDISKAMAMHYDYGTSNAWHFDVKAGTKLSVSVYKSSTGTTGQTIGYIVPYSYGYQQDADAVTDFSLEDVINGTIPATAGELFEDIRVWGSTQKSIPTGTLVSQLDVANMTTPYWYIVIQAKAKIDIAQIKSYAVKGYFSSGNKYQLLTTEPNSTLVKDIKTGYGSYRVKERARNILVQKGQYCYIRQATYTITGVTDTGYTYGPNSLTTKNGRLVTSNSDIVIW